MQIVSYMRLIKLILIALNIVWFIPCNAQELFEPTFKDLTPLWQTRVVETAAPIDSFRLRYLTPGWSDLHVHDGDAYIRYVSSNGMPFRQGATLVKYDTDDGAELGRFSANFLTSSIPEYLESVHFRDESILLIGTEEANSVPDGQYIHYSRLKYWKLDYDDLSLIEAVSDPSDTIGTYYPGFYDRHFVPSENGVFQYQSTFYHGSDVLFDYYTDQTTPDTTRNKVYPYETDTSPDFDEVYTRLVQVGENRVAAFIFYKDNPSLLFPEDAEFKLFEIQDDQVNQILQTNIKDYCYPFGGAFFSNFRMFDGDGQYAMHRLYYAATVEIDIRNWFLWLDENGEIIVAKDKLHYDDHVYYTLRNLSFNKERLYALAYPSISGEDGLDVIKISNTGEVELVGQVLTEGSVSFLNRLQGALIGDKVVLHGFPIKDEVHGGPILYAFNAEDLGVEAEPSSLADPIVAERFQVYPNPATAYIKLGLEAAKYQYTLINQNGETIRTEKVDQNSMIINVENLPSGPYFIRLVGEDDKKFISSFVKM